MFSVAVPDASTSTANVVEDCGRWLTVTGTFSDPPLTSSSTETAYFAVPAASTPNATFAAAASSSVIVTVALSPPEEAAFQPETEVETAAVNVSSPSTNSSDAIGIVRVAVVSFAATVTVDGLVPVSAGVAALPV